MLPSLGTVPSELRSQSDAAQPSPAVCQAASHRMNLAIPDEWVFLAAERLIDFIRIHISAVGGLNLARKVAAC